MSPTLPFSLGNAGGCLQRFLSRWGTLGDVSNASFLAGEHWGMSPTLHFSFATLGKTSHDTLTLNFMSLMKYFFLFLFPENQKATIERNTKNNAQQRNSPRTTGS
jgi:hypothetical protein